MPDSTPKRDGWGNRLRALLITMHLIAVIVTALPAPVGAGDRRLWQDPVAQNDLKRWEQIFARVGIEWKAKDIETTMFGLVNKTLEVRRGIVEPFRPYRKYAGVKQSWRMFTGANMFPHLLHVDIKEDDRWRTVYMSRSNDHEWRRKQLDHELMRSPIARMGMKGKKRSFRFMTYWIRRQAYADFPEASHVRVRIYKVQSPTPKEARRGVVHPGRIHLETIHSLAEPPRAKRRR